MNDTHVEDYAQSPLVERFKQIGERNAALEAAMAIENNLRQSNINERRANAINAVLHAKGSQTYVTVAEAESIWSIANTLDAVVQDIVSG